MGWRKVMMRSILVLGFLFIAAAPRSFALPEGDLTVAVFTGDLKVYFGVAPGDTINFSMIYFWLGNAPAPNVKLTFQPPAGINIVSSSVTPSSQGNNTLTWNLGTLNNYANSTIQMVAIVGSGVVEGSEIKAVASISGDVTDKDQKNNLSELPIKAAKRLPDLFIWKWGNMEVRDDPEGIFFSAEEGAPAELTIVYGNMGAESAPAVTLKEELPAGLEFASAEPAPTRVNGGVLEWDLGVLPMWQSGEIKVRVVPRQTGVFTARASIATTAQEGGIDGGKQMPNESEFKFRAVSLLPPVVLQPAAGFTNNGVVITPNPEFMGLAKGGATVTLYEGPEDHFGDDVTGMKLLDSTITGSGPTEKFAWTMWAEKINESREYYLYFRAEKDGKISGLSRPLHVTVNTALAEAGFDMGGYSVESGGSENKPGGLGGTTGTAPNEEVTITLRQTAPNGIDTDKNMQEFHRLKLTVDDHGTISETTVPVTRMVHVGRDSLYCFDSWDFIYVIPGYGPSVKITVEFKPVEYDCSTKVPEVIGDDIKITEILIDPAGYVYDVETAGREYTWPEVPPDKSLIEQATVTAYVRQGDQEWSVWDAPRYDQVNPQITDTITEDKVKEKGYYAFFVPSGQYRVMSQAPEYAGYESPILTVINEPIYHNVGMRRNKQTQTGVRDTRTIGELPKAITLIRNYPNPFNPSTNIFFMLPARGYTTLTIYNLSGQKVRELLAKDLPAGAHTIAWDGRNSEGRTVSSGVYFSVLNSGRFFGSSRMIMLK
ncbi:MAG: FlgD immunoglobulin-like domain containing protein [Candidatus Latescibacterota bacterium]